MDHRGPRKPKKYHGTRSNVYWKCSSNACQTTNYYEFQWMRSIIDHFKLSRDFPRLRIGIGRPPGKMDSASFVLRPFIKQEREELDFTFQHGLEAVRILVLKGIDKSATFFNSAKSMEQLG